MFRKVLGLNLKVNSYRLMINLETEIIIICPLGGVRPVDVCLIWTLIVVYSNDLDLFCHA